MKRWQLLKMKSKTNLNVKKNKTKNKLQQVYMKLLVDQILSTSQIQNLKVLNWNGQITFKKETQE